ncbi:MAG: transketolase [Clostridia bacterium]|nr:transketolase [Clostridia bacterium]
MDQKDIKFLETISKKCRYDIVRMISSAKSGHIGGALSSIDIYTYLLYHMSEDDRLIISHGHTSSALYAALGNMGYFDVEDAILNFRKTPPYEGHPSIKVNGVEWCSGSLGQGLSVGCGFAIARKKKNEKGKVYVVMGDGEQEKGQLQEAREFAIKHNLDNLIAIIDYNKLQASGSIREVGNDFIKAKYEMSGWNVFEIDGHSFEDMSETLKKAKGPCCIIAKTVMGKGIEKIENDFSYHGTLIDKETEDTALKTFELSEDEKNIIKNVPKKVQKKYSPICIKPKQGIEYLPGDKIDVRSALGNALEDVAKENPHIPILAFDCDLEGSVKLGGFKKVRPDGFIECGIAEQNAVTAACASSKSGVLSVQADFSVFNIAETYSQNRMADINECSVKLFCTHAGLDVGEDGKTHQCTDYLGLLANLHGFKTIVPSDANQADAAVRYAFSVPESVAIIGGRSKMPVLKDYNGEILSFEYGKGQWLKKGKDGVIITYGNMASRAVSASEELEKEGICIGVLNLPTPLCPDEEKIIEASKTGLVITYEDHNVKTGIGGDIAKIILKNKSDCRLVNLGVTGYGSSASPDRLYEMQGIDTKNLIETVKENVL